MKHILLIVGAMIACLAAPAGAQTEAPLPTVESPAVETLNCEQMQAEMMSAGQLMNQQMDPNFGANVQAMQADNQRQMDQARTAAVGSGLLCAVPGLGGACAAAMNAQAARQAGQAEANRERMDVVTGAIQDSTAGIDMQRMSAISQRLESERCETRQGAMQR